MHMFNSRFYDEIIKKSTISQKSQIYDPISKFLPTLYIKKNYGKLLTCCLF